MCKVFSFTVSNWAENCWCLCKVAYFIYLFIMASTHELTSKSCQFSQKATTWNPQLAGRRQAICWGVAPLLNRLSLAAVCNVVLHPTEGDICTYIKDSKWSLVMQHWIENKPCACVPYQTFWNVKARLLPSVTCLLTFDGFGVLIIEISTRHRHIGV